MNIERDGNPDEYLVTALQIFEYCGVDRASTLRVDTLMDKFAPFVKTNKAEYSYLKSLLDPDQNNPEIDVPKLAETLNKYSVSQKVKVDLDESFNLRNGQVPHDSDSGISTDGFQLLEELQCELREKSHLAHQLRSQLDFTDRQHEEVLAALTAERDSLRAHLGMLREENVTLTHVRRDYEDACERLCLSERALEDTKRELDGNKKRLRVLTEQVCSLETEKLTLGELLAKSKAECHRINEMYASRQSALLEQNERLRSEHADLSVRLQDHEEFMQTVVKEKVQVEMELKDLLNKTNQTHLKLDRSIDVSYTEDQMLSALDSLNAESRFATDHRNIADESFASTFKDDRGCATNLSLMDEIRLSFCNTPQYKKSRVSSNFDKIFDSPITNILSQDNDICIVNDNEANFNNRQRDVELQTDHVEVKYFQVQTSFSQDSNFDVRKEFKNVEVQTNIEINLNNNKEFQNVAVQNNLIDKEFREMEIQTDTVKELTTIITQTAGHTKMFSRNTVADKTEFRHVEIQTSVNDLVIRKEFMDVGVQSNVLNGNLDSKESRHVEIQTDKEVTINVSEVVGQTKFNPRNARPLKLRKVIRKKCNIAIQTDEIFNNNEDNKCLECEKLNEYTIKLENDYRNSHNMLMEMKNEIEKYENNLNVIKRFVDEGNERNDYLRAVVDDLKTRLTVLDETCTYQREEIDKLSCDTKAVSVQTECEQVSTHSQTDLPCSGCVKRNGTHRLRRYLWDPLKCLFQLFAIICFLCAISALYGVTRRWQSPCTPLAPWSWLQPNDLMDLLFHIEYISDVPM